MVWQPQLWAKAASPVETSIHVLTGSPHTCLYLTAAQRGSRRKSDQREDKECTAGRTGLQLFITYHRRTPPMLLTFSLWLYIQMTPAAKDIFLCHFQIGRSTNVTFVPRIWVELCKIMVQVLTRWRKITWIASGLLTSTWKALQTASRMDNFTSLLVCSKEGGNIHCKNTPCLSWQKL